MNNVTVSEGFINNQKLPLMITPKDPKTANLSGLMQYLERNQEWFNEALLKYGAVLFRGFNVTEPTDFSQFVAACRLGNFMPYVGGTTPRTQLSEGVFTSTEAPAHIHIRLHNEMSYLETYPKHVYFCCNTPSETLGATPLANSRAVYQSLEPGVRERLETKGVLYKRYLFEENWIQKKIAASNRALMPWEKIYGTKDRTVVEAKLRASHINFEWLPKNKGLKTWIKLPAFKTHPLTNEKVWFNQINQFNDFDSVYHYPFGPKWAWFFRNVIFDSETLPMTTAYGDGTPLSVADVKNILKTLEQNIIRFPWEEGDLLVIDNYLAMHGREPFTGKRKIMASLTL